MGDFQKQEEKEPEEKKIFTPKDMNIIREYISGGRKVKYNIIKSYGDLSEDKASWKKQLNLVSWSDSEAKIDIREWSPDYNKMSKGVTLNIGELKRLRELLNSVEL